MRTICVLPRAIPKLLNLNTSMKNYTTEKLMESDVFFFDMKNKFYIRWILLENMIIND